MTAELTPEEITTIRDLFLAHSELRNVKILSDNYIPAVETFDAALLGLLKTHPNFNPVSNEIDFPYDWYGPDTSDLPEHWQEPRMVDDEMTPYQLVLESAFAARDAVDLVNPTYTTIENAENLWNEIHDLFTYSPNYNVNNGIVEAG